MKRIETIIQPHKLEAVLTALDEIGVGGVTVAEVTGFGRQKGHSEVYRDSEYKRNLIPKNMLIIYVSDSLLQLAVSTILQTTRSGKIGDGKIIVSNVENVVRIRTGEQDEDALG
jgi:nitrogen regulatory protein P-II 1